MGGCAKQARALSFTTELRIPPDRTFLSLVEAFVVDASLRAELSDEQRRGILRATMLAFETTVEEALTECSEPLHVIAACTPRHLTLSLCERGLPIDDALARRDSKWNELSDAVDEAHWHLHGSAGSELRLAVTRSHGMAAADTAPPQEEEDVAIAPPQEYTVRRFEPKDAAGVARAFYLTYGYAYDLPAVYVPSRLIELNESGRYVSIVAIDAAGDVAGHYALARDADVPIADACGAVVLPAHRGRNLLNELRDRAEKEATELGLAAYYSEPVTDHPRTQAASESFGAKACGITLGEAPRSFVARHMELSTTSQRQSCMLYIKVLRAREARTIYPPPHHRTTVTAIYEQLQLPITAAAGEPTVRQRGVFHTAITRADGIATIEVATVGYETAELIGQTVEDLRATNRLGAMYASLPLEDPGTPALCEALEGLGFFFSGVGPWMLGGKDSLRLQMPLTPIDLSALVVIGEFGRRLLDYVAAERERCTGLPTSSTGAS